MFYFQVLLQVVTHGGGATVGSQYTPLPESSAGAGDHMGEIIVTLALTGVGSLLSVATSPL